MASDNATVSVTMSEAVYAAYSSGTASGDLAVSDFVLAVSGGEATLNSATPSSILGPGSFTSIGTYNGHTYYRSNSTATWADAKTICENAGGYLAVITTAAENNFIHTNRGLNAYTWIGLSDEATEGTQVWVTGETFSYTNWKSGQPNNITTQDHSFLGYANGEWWDDYGHLSYYYILEIPSASPSPSYIYTLGIDYAGLPNGYEVLTVSPAENAIYDAAGNIGSTTQSNNQQTFTEERVREISTIEHNTSFARWNSFVKVDSNTYALAYEGSGNDGYIQTFTIPTSGSSITKVTTVEHDNYINYYSSILQVDADTYIAAYHGYYSGYGAQIRTFTIPVDGSAVTTVYTLKHLSGNY